MRKYTLFFSLSWYYLRCKCYLPKEIYLAIFCDLNKKIIQAGYSNSQSINISKHIDHYHCQTLSRWQWLKSQTTLPLHPPSAGLTAESNKKTDKSSGSFGTFTDIYTLFCGRKQEPKSVSPFPMLSWHHIWQGHTMLSPVGLGTPNSLQKKRCHDQKPQWGSAQRCLYRKMYMLRSTLLSQPLP